MEFTINRENLLHLLNKIIRVVNIKQTNPIYSHILVEVNPGTIRVTASDIQLQISVAGNFETNLNGSFVIPARKTIEILKNLNSKNITIKTKNGEVVFSSEKFRFKLKTLDSTHFKLIENLKSPVVIKTQAFSLRKAIESTVFVPVVNGTLVYAEGILLESSKNKVSAVATDSYRMSLFDFVASTEEKTDREFKSVIPKKTADEMKAVLETIEEEVTLEITQSEIALNSHGARLVSKLIDCNFPNYSQYLGSPNKEYLVVNKDELLHAIKAVSVLGEGSSPRVFLSVKKNQIEIVLSHQEESGNYTISNSECTIDKELRVEFVCRYLVEAIRVLQSSQAKIEFFSQENIIIIRGVEAANDSVHIISLVKND